MNDLIARMEKSAAARDVNEHLERNFDFTNLFWSSRTIGS